MGILLIINYFKQTYRLHIFGILASCIIGIAHAADFEIHGYGYQDYIQTSRNHYLGADDKGYWNDNFLGIVGAVKINQKSKLWAQLQGSSTDQTRFTWFFVDYQFTNQLRGHAGLVRLPAGLYNEIIDAKYLQVSQLEPSLYQEAADMVYDSYHGIGLDYDHDIGAGHLLWQVYGGNTYYYSASLIPEDSRDRRMIGGRATYRTPVDGLRFMLSLNRVQIQPIGQGISDNTLHNEDRSILSASYVNNNYDIKAEYGNHEKLAVTSRGGYLQCGYSLNQKWRPYVRYDYFTTNTRQQSDPSYFQETFLLGVEYKLATNLSARIENHFNSGYALPVALGEITAGSGSDHWGLFVAGINFVF